MSDISVVHLFELNAGDFIQFSLDSGANVYKVNEGCNDASLWCNHGGSTGKTVELTVEDNTAYLLTQSQAEDHREDPGFIG